MYLMSAQPFEFFKLHPKVSSIAEKRKFGLKFVIEERSKKINHPSSYP
jgi:hypothetical protein